MLKDFQLLKIMKYSFMILFTINFLISCSPKELSHDKLNAYLQDESNGLKQVQTVGSFTYSLTYRPTDILVWQELSDKKNVQDSIVGKLKKKYQDYNYYLLSISADSKDVLNSASPNMQVFSQNLQTLSFRMAEYTYAVTEKKDTIPLADFYFPRLYGMGGSTQVLLAYNKNNEPGTYTDIYVDDIGLGTGRQVFRFKKEDIEKTPKLNYQL
jgi:hypothetical protein